MARILVVSDSLKSSESLIKVLQEADHQTTSCVDKGAFERLEEQGTDLILLDMKLPAPQILDLISDLSSSFALPILLLTSTNNALEALQAGADQYLVKPFASASLLVHIEVLLRRVFLEKQRLTLQHCSQQFSLKVARLPLTETELLLTQYLSKKDGEVVSKMTLQKEVLKKELSAFDRNLDVHISNIRRKMFNAGLSKFHIKTVHGKGYTFSEHVI